MADKKLKHLSVRMTMHYGAVEIEYGLVEHHEIANEMEQRRHFDLMQMQLQEQHNHFAAEILPKIPHLEMPTENRVPGSQETFPAVKLIREDKNGKTYYKFLTPPGTPYGKFGAYIWDEKQKEYGIPDIMGSSTSLDLTGVEIVVEKTTKSAKVVKILQAANMALPPQGEHDVPF